MEVLRQWWQSLSGNLLGFLSVVGAAAGLAFPLAGPVVGATATVATAVIFLVAGSQYQAWKNEREDCNAEFEERQRALIDIAVKEVKYNERRISEGPLLDIGWSHSAKDDSLCLFLKNTGKDEAKNITVLPVALGAPEPFRFNRVFSISAGRDAILEIAPIDVVSIEDSVEHTEHFERDWHVFFECWQTAALQDERFKALDITVKYANSRGTAKFITVLKVHGLPIVPRVYGVEQVSHELEN